MTTPVLTPALLAQLSEWTATAFGLRFEVERWNDLTRGLSSAARELGVEDFVAWAAQLAAGECPAEHVAAVAGHLTISETYFFRHPDHFARLENDIIPARLAARTGTHGGLRIWSAGCASGEEPYSIAMLLHRRFGPAVLEPSRVCGTDLGREVIARAKAGKYSRWSFRDAPDWLESSYFTPAGPGHFQLVAEIRQRVTFRVLNLAAPLYPVEFGPGANFDLILCRNVLMYLSAAHQQEVLRRFAQALAPEGWLLTGPCDVARDAAESVALMPDTPGWFQKRTSPRAFLDQPLRHRGSGPAAEPTAGDFALEPAATAPDLEAPAARRQIGDEHLEDRPAAGAPRNPEAVPATFETPVPAATAGEAQTLADRGELDAALEACDAALEADRTSVDLYYLRGCILQEQDQLAGAEQSFRRALYLEPTNPAVLFALGCLQERQEDFAHARHHFRLVLAELSHRDAAEPLAGTNGLTAGRMRALVEAHLNRHAAA